MALTALTHEEILAPPATMLLETAARAFGMGRSKAYGHAAAGPGGGGCCASAVFLPG